MFFLVRGGYDAQFNFLQSVGFLETIRKYA